MIVVMKPGATAGEIGAVIARVQELGLTPHPIYGEEHTVVAVVGNERKIDKEIFEVMPGVEKTMVVMHPFKLASRTSKPEDTVIALNGVKIGGKRLVIMAGPCSVESRSQVLETAWAVKEAGATILRGGAFKPRSWWPNTQIFCRSARATCRTTACCTRWAESSARCCSNAG